MEPHLVEWDELHLRLRGETIARIAGEKIREQKAPVSHLEFQFAPDELTVTGRVVKIVPIPFTVVVRRIAAMGTSIRIHLEEASAFGLPLPSFLMKLAEKKIDPDDLSWDHQTRSFLLRLDRFLPPFVDIDISEIRVIDHGVAIRLGRGGATPPLP